MKKLSVPRLIVFRNSTDRVKKTFVEKLKSTAIETATDGGGDYWVTSVSAIGRSYRQNDPKPIMDTTADLKTKKENHKHIPTKNMYQSNIDVLEKYKWIDAKVIRPSIISFLKKSTANPILTVRGLQVEAKPTHIFLFGKKGEEKIGAVWFVAKKQGYRTEEVGMFCELLYRFLRINYGKKYQLSPAYCTAVDVVSANAVNYSDFEEERFPNLLNATLDEINKIL